MGATYKWQSGLSGKHPPLNGVSSTSIQLHVFHNDRLNLGRGSRETSKSVFMRAINA